MSENVLEIIDLSVACGTKKILEGVNLKIPKGQVHGIFGRNGSGKTTLMMTIMGFPQYRITGGNILYQGQDLSKLTITERAQAGIAICQQRPPTIEGVSLRKIIAILADKQGDKGAQEVEALVVASNMKDLLDREINGALSGGEIKRSELLQLLVLSPQFSMMDEPDSGIDIEALSLIGKLMAKLYENDRGGLIITHSGSIMEYVHVDQAHLMSRGTIIGSAAPQVLLKGIRTFGYDNWNQPLD